MSNGTFTAKKKNGSEYYRSSFTYKGRHISLGSFDSEDDAKKAYLAARALTEENASSAGVSQEEYRALSAPLPFSKYVSIVNFRDNGVYFATPIYLMRRFFYYYISPEEALTFDAEDLFYFAHHKIQRRGGRLFVSDYGMQVTLSTRYGIRPYAVPGRDFEFLNGDPLDYRYENIRIISRYAGVTVQSGQGIPSFARYKVKIHLRGNYTVGIFDDEITAAVAYNKAADHIKTRYPEKKYAQNFIEALSAKAYAEIYTGIDISDFIRSFNSRHPSGICNPQS